MNDYKINKKIAEVEGLAVHPMPESYLVCIETKYGVVRYDPANNWEQAGALIEKHGVCLTHNKKQWEAYIPYQSNQRAQTPQKAAMLAIIEACQK